MLRSKSLEEYFLSFFRTEEWKISCTERLITICQTNRYHIAEEWLKHCVSRRSKYSTSLLWKRQNSQKQRTLLYGRFEGRLCVINKSELYGCTTEAHLQLDTAFVCPWQRQNFLKLFVNNFSLLSVFFSQVTKIFICLFIYLFMVKFVRLWQWCVYNMWNHFLYELVHRSFFWGQTDWARLISCYHHLFTGQFRFEPWVEFYIAFSFR